MVSQYARIRNAKSTVDARRINRNTFWRKVRLASYVPIPRLVKRKK